MIASLGWGGGGRGEAGGWGGVTRTTAVTGESCEIYTTVNFVYTRARRVCAVRDCLLDGHPLRQQPCFFFKLDKASFVACCRTELIKEPLSGEWLARGSRVQRVTSSLLLRDAQLGNLQWM